MPTYENAHELARKADRSAAATRCAVPGECRRCGVAVLTGPDSDQMPRAVTVAAEPITGMAEALVHWRSELQTYDLLPATGKDSKPGTFHLWHRESWHRMKPPPDNPIHVEHCCRIKD